MIVVLPGKCPPNLGAATCVEAEAWPPVVAPVEEEPVGPGVVGGKGKEVPVGVDMIQSSSQITQ
jgi:hypothetical protein